MQPSRSQLFTRTPFPKDEHGPLYGSHPGQALLEIQKRFGLPQCLGGSRLLGIGMSVHGFFTIIWLISKISWIITNSPLLHGQGIFNMCFFYNPTYPAEHNETWVVDAEPNGNMPPPPRRAMGPDRNCKQLDCPVPIAHRGGGSAEVALEAAFSYKKACMAVTTCHKES